MSEFTNPFQINSDEPACDAATCTPCNADPSAESCFICGYPHNAFENCRSAHVTPCLDGAVECLDCESSFSNIKFLGGYVAGFSSKLGLGPSESSVTVDLVVLKHDCSVQNTGCLTPPPCTDDQYTGQLGHIYTFNIGGFCFRGILNNHNYTEDSSGYKYKVTLTDGRSILSGCGVLLNGIYDPIPDDLQPNVINILRELESSIYDDTCGDLTRCNEFMQSGADKQGIYVYKAIEALNKKCVSVPISGAGLVLNLDNIKTIINKESRTTNQESTVLELIQLACDESGLGFFVQLNNNNELEFIPINYKVDPESLDLFSYVESLNQQGLVISKDYGQEMTLEKNKKILFGSEYCYLTSVNDFPRYNDSLPDPDYTNCLILQAPWMHTRRRSLNVPSPNGGLSVEPILSEIKSGQECFPYSV